MAPGGKNFGGYCGRTCCKNLNSLLCPSYLDLWELGLQLGSGSETPMPRVSPTNAMPMSQVEATAVAVG